MRDKYWYQTTCFNHWFFNDVLYFQQYFQQIMRNFIV
jgi:hypothetical protein